MHVSLINIELVNQIIRKATNSLNDLLTSWPFNWIIRHFVIIHCELKCYFVFIPII